MLACLPTGLLRQSPRRPVAPNQNVDRQQTHLAWNKSADISTDFVTHVWEILMLLVATARPRSVCVAGVRWDSVPPRRRRRLDCKALSSVVTSRRRRMVFRYTQRTPASNCNCINGERARVWAFYWTGRSCGSLPSACHAGCFAREAPAPYDTRTRVVRHPSVLAIQTSLVHILHGTTAHASQAASDIAKRCYSSCVSSHRR